MDRRNLLTWGCRTFAALGAAVVAVPGISFLLAPLRRREGGSSLVRRLCLLDALSPGVPNEQVLTGNRRDAWTLYPRETLGRVWLIRRSAANVGPEEAQVDAFTTICPHLGCEIGLASSGDQFFCPCHKAFFKMSGEAIRETDDGEKNPAPRDMDPLTCRIVQDATTDAWWVEVEYQKFALGSEKKLPKG